MMNAASRSTITRLIDQSPAPYPNRWKIATAAAAVMLTIGTIYSWAIFTQPLLVAYRWDLTTTTWAYAIANFSLAAVGAVIGGGWQDKVGPRTVAMVGVTLWVTVLLLSHTHALNYGLILSAWGCAGVIGPMIVALAKDLTGSFAGVLPLIAVVLAAAVILPYLTKRPTPHSRAAAKTTRPSTFPVPFPRTVPVRNFVKP